jgi:hypothetical protein
MTASTFEDDAASTFVCGDRLAVEVATETAGSLRFDAVTGSDITADSTLEALARRGYISTAATAET